MGKKPWLMVVVLMTVAHAACGDSRGPRDPFIAAIAGADRMTLHEGLPHQHFERALVASERLAKPVRELDGHPFYQAPIALPAADAARLAQLVADPATFEPFLGEKLCGGFHPDYAAEWQKGADSYRMLICLGCGEAKLIGPGIDLRYDLSEPVRAELKEWRKRHRQNRPPGRF